LNPEALARLAARLEARSRRAISAPKQAAVLVPLVLDAQGARLLLTRRTEDLSSHRGQVAFPGGRAEPTDRDLIDTALRESEEEIGLHRQHVDVLGMLDDFPTVDGAMVVTPVLGLVRSLPVLTPQPSEVARIFSIPVAALQVLEGWRVEEVPWRKSRWPLYHFDHDGETLWGLSAYITLMVLALVDGGSPFELNLEAAFRGSRD
jgi:8-oxo-dGTP pyrophosphatase MutT (NUDIX family)